MVDAKRTSIELDRAYELLMDIFNLHIATRRSITLVSAMPDSDQQLAGQIAVNERIRVGRARSAHVDDFEEGVNGRDLIRQEFEGDFDRLRRVTLVSACGALEYLVKATYVDRAAQDPVEAGARLEQARVKLNASEVVNLDATERWYLVADRLLEHLGEQPQCRPYGERIRRLLMQFAPRGATASTELEKVLSGEHLPRLNEAFLVRNSLVHNGGRVGAALSRVAGYELGSVIVLNRHSGPPLLAAVSALALAIHSDRWEF